MTSTAKNWTICTLAASLSCSPPRSNIFVELALMADKVLRQARAAWGDVTPKTTERNRRKRNRRRVKR